MSEIKAIGQQTVHLICSGQVVLDLATAVKELLENSLDAHASSIEIKVKEYGKTCIEVIDNGQGVEEGDFQGLTLKHHTSKLQEFSDLTSVETFGFRGEALSSLCALCTMTITTRHKTAKLAHKLEFDANGTIVKKSCTARPPGTTVILKDIFNTLPVRRKEFEKNLKREYTKLLNLLNAYCIVSTGVRISCSNETDKGSRSGVLATMGTAAISDNIAAIFGSKQTSSLMEFNQIPASPEICEQYFLKYNEAVEFCEDCVISGRISSCAPGLGRNSNDRQFFSINKRPCEMQKVAKVVNEVFHMFNRYQYPFVQLDISTNRTEVDVNVTPDKRKIFLLKEKHVFAIIKTSLLEMFNGQNHTIGFTKTKPSLPAILSNNKDEAGFGVSVTKQIISPVKSKSNTENQIDRAQGTVENAIGLGLTQQPFASSKLNLSHFSRNSFGNIPATQCKNKSKKRHYNSDLCTQSSKLARIDDIFPTAVADSKVVCSEEKNAEEAILVKGEGDFQKNVGVAVTIDAPADNADKITCDVFFSFEAMKRAWEAQKLLELCKNKGGKLQSPGTFKAKISSNENQQAEAELSKFFEKRCFEDMVILGQFNLGFIIARHKNDLFIIDQHAADEKFNFEMLQEKTSLLGQPLIVPQKLELTAGERLVMQENAEIFHKNGFGFKIEQKENEQEAIHLTKVPSSQNWTFDASDVSELIFMLTDAPHVLCRPSRVRQMFASRACRKSVMVGTALTHSEMKRLVGHMAEMDQPWNCPHGRPTMRHLADLSMITKLKK